MYQTIRSSNKTEFVTNVVMSMRQLKLEIHETFFAIFNMDEIGVA